MKIRVGLVGLGDQWQTRHRPALLALSDRFEVKGICCEIAKKSEQVAREFNARAFDGFRAMLECNEIDAVFSLATDWAGPVPILAACDAGKAIYSSTALDIAPDQVKEIRQRIEKSGVAFMAELPRRHSPATQRLKELIATRLGKPRLMFCHERLSTEQQSDRKRRGEYCPITWRNLMELVDWCCYLVDRDPSSVMSAICEQPFEDLNSFYQMINLSFSGKKNEDDPDEKPDAIAAQISVGHYIPSRWKDALSYRRPASIQVCCENGMAFVDLPSTLIWFDDAGQHTESLDTERPVGEQMLTLFYRAVTSLIRKTSDLDDAYRAMLVVLAANQSAENGRRIELDFDNSTES